MTAEQETGAQLQRLVAEIEDDLAAAEEKFAQVNEALEVIDQRPGEKAPLSYLAWSIHHYYTAIEAALQRIARHRRTPSFLYYFTAG